MLTLQVINVSTRKGRKGPAVAEWFAEYARQSDQFRVEVVDLAEVDLPIYDEEVHPRLGQYEHEHTRRWSQIVRRADAYVFVTPEYNHVTPASLVNALTYLNAHADARWLREGWYLPSIEGFFEKIFAPLGLRKIQDEVLGNLKKELETAS